jgi:hypothetical protein
MYFNWKCTSIGNVLQLEMYLDLSVIGKVFQLEMYLDLNIG